MNTQIKISKKNKEYYANKMFNKTYNRLSDVEIKSLNVQYAIEHCILTEEDKKILMIEEEYDRSGVPSFIVRQYR